MSNTKSLISGMKKSSWYTEKGKKVGLITFGEKKDVIVSLDDYEWENVLNIDIKKEDIDAGDLQVWLKNDYEKNNRILVYNKLSKYLYIDSKKEYWLDYSLIDSLNKKEKNEPEVVRGKILYTKKNAGFFLLMLGNWYFLPKGESLTFYRPGIWESNYGSIISKISMYTDGISKFIFSNNIGKLDFKISVEKINILYNILERLLAHELNYTFYKGSKRNKRAKRIRKRSLMCYSYFLYILSPIIKDMDRLLKISEKEGIDLNKIIGKGVGLREKKLKDYEKLLVEIKKKLLEVNTKEELYYYWVYNSVIELIYNSEQEGNINYFTLERLGGVEVRFSKADKWRLTSVSRKNLV